jgi:hypothetical protein
VRLPLAVVVAGGMMLGSAEAQEANNGAVSVGTGIDFGSSYYFRGIIQETEGLIAQPYLEAGITVYESDTGLQSVSLTAGTWSSLHSGPSGSDGAGGDPQMWYETDFYVSGALGFADAWSVDATYTAYMSPNQSFGTVKEVAFGVAYDDGLIGPYATLAVEADGQADGGLNEGTYLELGAEPGLAIPNSDVGLSFPVALGLSMSDYYEGAAGDDTFGFFNVGAIVSIPLSGVPAQYGAWEISGGINLLVFGDALKSINGSTDDVEPIGVFGISLGY